MFVLTILKNILLSALGEKVVAKAFFGLAEFLAEKTTNPVDNEVIQEWKQSYYSR